MNDPKFILHYFELIKDYHELKYNEHSFVLFHYPVVDWNGKFHGTIQLYGHIHAKESAFLQEQFGRCYHVGIDSNNYAPISIDEVIARMEHVDRVGFIDDLYQDAKVNVWHQVVVMTKILKNRSKEAITLKPGCIHRGDFGMKQFCYECYSEQEVIIVRKKEVFLVKGEPIKVVSDVMICTVCGEEIFNKEFDGKNMARVYQKFRNKHN